MTTTLEIKNYRCFSREHPVRLELRPAFTAFVGLNNAGKSTILRFFFEMRDLLQQISDWNTLLSLFQGRRTPASIPDPQSSDRQAVFCDHADGPLELSIHMDSDASDHASLFPFTLTFLLERATNTLAVAPRLQVTPASFESVMIEGGLLREGPQHIARLLADLNPFRDACQLLTRAMYVPAFRNALPVESRQGALYYDIFSGSPLIQEWHERKSGANRAGHDVARRLTEDLARIFGFKQLEINASKDLNTLRLTVESKSYPLGEVGSGFAQFFVILLNAALKKPSYVLIDEPELNLHPSLQLDFLTTLASYASEGVFFATHSLGLARAAADRIFSVRKEEQTSRIQPFEATKSLAEFLGELSYSGYYDLGYRRVVLVEGQTDVRAIQQLLRLFRKDHEVVLLPLGGDALIKGSAEIELSEVKRLSNDVRVLIDSERKASGDPLPQNRREFLELCERLSIPCHVLERRALENYFPGHAVQQARGPGGGALGHYDDLKNHEPGWPKSENWRIAREMQTEDLAGTDLGNFLASLY